MNGEGFVWQREAASPSPSASRPAKSEPQILPCLEIPDRQEEHGLKAVRYSFNRVSVLVYPLEG